MKKKYLASRTSSTNEDYNADCDLVLIEVTPDLRCEIERRVAVADTLAAAEGKTTLAFVEWWDSRPMAFAAYTIRPGGSEELNETLEKLAEELNDSLVWQAVELDLGDREPEATRSDRFVVAGLDGDFWWVCSPKHCAFEIETERLDLRKLQELLGVKP